MSSNKPITKFKLLFNNMKRITKYARKEDKGISSQPTPSASAPKQQNKTPKKKPQKRKEVHQKEEKLISIPEKDVPC